MKLTIVDNTGRLTADPNTWPAELKQAIEQCCCSSSGSSGSSSPGGRKTACCPNLELPDVLSCTISGGTAIDGTYALTWDGTLNAWATPKIFQFTCFIGLSLHTFSFRLAFNLFCDFVWEQFDDNGFGLEVVNGRMGTQWPLCMLGMTCSPFYFGGGLIVRDLLPPWRACGGASVETSNACAPTFAGPLVEITL